MKFEIQFVVTQMEVQQKIQFTYCWTEFAKTMQSKIVIWLQNERKFKYNARDCQECPQNAQLVVVGVKNHIKTMVRLLERRKTLGMIKTV